MKQASPTFFQLFLAWFRIGLFTFGGGYAMLPLIEKEAVKKHNWVSQEDMLVVFALAQSVPGVIAVNTAVCLGHRLLGMKGAIAATMGVVFPSLLIILLIALSFDHLTTNAYVMRAFSGISAAVVGLLFAAGIRIALAAVKDRMSLIILLFVFAFSLLTNIHPLVFIGIGALLGFLCLRKGGKSQCS